jgi:hypothetical protein
MDTNTEDEGRELRDLMMSWDSTETDRELRALLRSTRPPQIDQLWNGTAPLLVADNPRLLHFYAQDVNAWCSEQELVELLDSKTRLRALVNKLYYAICHLGSWSEENMPHDLDRDPAILVADCPGCNTPHDAGSLDPNSHCNTHQNVLPTVRLGERVPQSSEALSTVLHVCTFTAEFVCHLLSTNAHADKLVLMMTPDMPPNLVSTSQMNLWVMARQQGDRGVSLPNLLGLLDNCSSRFPKATFLGAGVMSCIICRRPAQALVILDKDMVVKSLYRYGSYVFTVIKSSKCLVEYHFGLTAFFNIIPTLFFYGLWNERMYPGDPQNSVIAVIASLVVNMCHNTSRHDGDPSDNGVELDKEFPELKSIQSILGNLLRLGESDDQWKREFLENHPLSFAVAAGMEILGWWAINGIDLSLAQIPTSNSGPITVRVAIQEYLEQFRIVAERHPQLSYMMKVATAIAEGHIPPSPDSEALLHDSLVKVSSRCGLDSCRKQGGVDGTTLLKCSGCRLEQYCCAQHQKKHWKIHKRFCRKNRGSETSA